ncbi:unnamed protein product [Closterium sp. NIES-54]
MAKFTAMKECGTRQPLIGQLQVTGDGEKLRVESLLDSLLFVSKCDAPMGLWVKLVRYLAEKGVKGFPKKGYGTYYTTYGFGELAQATATWLQTTQLEHVLTSPFIGISLDESTNRCSGKHMILYVTFIRDSKVATEFMTLITVDKGDAAKLVGLLVSHLQAVGIDLRRISGISTDGANVMMSSKSGLVTRLRLRIPHLVSSHCIAHSTNLSCMRFKEALAAKHAAENIPAFNVVDKVIRTVAEHLGRSGPWHQRCMDLQDVFTSTSLELQGIHAVRWLSRGDAVLHFIAVLPGLIVMLKEWDADLYALVTSYSFHFLLFFIANVLEQLNILNRAFQHKELDYASVYGQIRRTTSHIESRYVDCGDDFGGGVSERLSPFLARHGPGGNREATLEGVDSDGRPTRFKFKLHEDEVEDFEGPATHDGRRSSLSWSPGLATSREWQGPSYSPLMSIHWTEAKGSPDAFSGCRPWSLWANKNDRSFHAGLTAMLKTPEWRENYPNLVQLWVAVAVLPLSTVECERGFSRQNIIKSWQRGAMKDARLGDLMCMSLMQYEPKWDEIVTIWRSYKKRKPHSNAPTDATRQHSRQGKEHADEMEVVDVRGPLSEGLGFESQCVHFGHPGAGGCQRSTGDPRLILGKGYRLVVLGGYGRTDPLLNKPFYPNDLVVGILTVDL